MKAIPQSELQFSFSRSSGAGGQNVNKVNTKATLSWDMDNSPSCFDQVKKRFHQKYKRFVVNGMVVIHSQKHRSQKRNIDDCVEKLHELLLSVEFAPKKRRATKPTKGSVKRRLDGKKMNSLKKRLRTAKHD